ncbi:hypothetical protein [Ruminococcus sp.]|uniref:hypothetical protein n=1 Tax=Ruminococcus sp. TaxID=41978 RepID=UPI0025D128FD|nr:hypothetical protein [Ruminococcus sp.]
MIAFLLILLIIVAGAAAFLFYMCMQQRERIAELNAVKKRMTQKKLQGNEENPAVHNLKSEVARLQNENRKMSETINSAKISFFSLLEKREREAKARLQEQLDKNKQLEEKCVSLKRQVSLLQETADSTRQTSNSTQKRKEEFANIEKKNVLMQNQYDQLLSENQDLLKERDALNRDLFNLQNEKQQIEQILMKSKKMLFDLETKNKKQEELITSQNTEIRKLRQFAQQNHAKRSPGKDFEDLYNKLVQKYTELYSAYQKKCRDTNPSANSSISSTVSSNSLTHDKVKKTQQSASNLTDVKMATSLFQNIDKVNEDEFVAYLTISHNLSGDLRLSEAGNYRNAQIVALRNGMIIPNPYYYANSLTNGEFGDSFDKIKDIFRFSTQIYNDAKYYIETIAPARFHNEKGNYIIESQGEIGIKEV